jgi:hypothetical protein
MLREPPMSNEPSTPRTHHDDHRDLAQAIRRGVQRRPEQSFGEYYRGRHASCALGAAYEGLYRLPEEAAGIHPKDLWHYYECLDFTIKWCPGADCRKHLPLAALIVHLNDVHRWTREQIADWLSSLALPAPASGA